MTLNDVEQAVRNLITNQPMITTGSSGEVVNSLMSIISSYRNFRFLIQNHPAQDSFKFNTMNLAQRMESEMSNLIVQTLQERGINLMVYMPATAQFGGTQNPYLYGNMNATVNANLAPNMNSGVLGGQVVYNQPMQSPSFGQSNGVQYNQPMQYPQAQFRPNNMPRPVPMNQGMMMKGTTPMYPKTAAPTQPISFGDLSKPTVARPKPKNANFSISTPTREPKFTGGNHKNKHLNVNKVENIAPAPAPMQAPVQEYRQPEPVMEEPVVPTPVEAPVQVESTPVPPSKAAGRNYLLELLKK